MNNPTSEQADSATVRGLAEKIDALLPQTQCQRCGYPACKPYADAISCGEADINQCPPGGAHGIRRLAELLGRAYIPLSPQHGTEMGRQVVLIDESLCIGCTLCIKACPVDAIVGASKLMHTVIAEQCTGCELCIPPCPVDCIDLVQLAPPATDDATGPYKMTVAEKQAADQARSHYEFHLFRLDREERERAARLAARTRAAPAGGAGNTGSTDPKQALIAAALERVRAKQAAQSTEK